MSKQLQKPHQIRVPDGIWNWLKSQARAEERSINYVLNRLLEQKQREAQHG
jgi:hypothetical protein